MRAAWYERNGSARNVLQVGELAKPVVQSGTVLVRVHATGVNPSDTKRRARVPLLPGNQQQIPHQDGAGVIEEVGDGVSASRLGQRVWIYEAPDRRSPTEKTGPRLREQSRAPATYPAGGTR